MAKSWSSDFTLQEDLLLDGLFQFQAWVRSQEFESQSLVLLSGPMGLGKTEFVKTWVRSNIKQLSVDVASPSFAIHNAYKEGESLIYHFDLFRIQSEQELDGTGFWDLLLDSFQVAFIEWPERVKSEDWPVDRWIYHYQFQMDDRAEQRRIQKKIRPPCF